MALRHRIDPSPQRAGGWIKLRHTLSGVRSLRPKPDDILQRDFSRKLKVFLSAHPFTAQHQAKLKPFSGFDRWWIDNAGDFVVTVVLCMEAAQRCIDVRLQMRRYRFEDLCHVLDLPKSNSTILPELVL